MKKVSIGVENFKQIIDENYYFVDKSSFISNVLKEYIAFYTRPRRFGKTLNMSMLYYFFSIKEKDNAYLFNDLDISKNEEACHHQNQYPVVFITLKEMKDATFKDQLKTFGIIIRNLMNQNIELLESPNLTEYEKDALKKYCTINTDKVELEASLQTIIYSLRKHYGEKVIVLIDEYDVPLQSAYTYDYYEDMRLFISKLFSAALKTNDNLERGILTGCLRISKESIFTGLNNFNVFSITEKISSDSFGFTYDETMDMVHYYGLDDKLETIKEWYDGYLFGYTEIYNPWSVSKYIKKSLNDDSEPESFWANTSGNEIVHQYIDEADNQLHKEFEQLVKGNCIEKKISPELTYREMDSIDNIYSFLLFTGYLKIHKITDKTKNLYELEIPNREVKEIYENIFETWFKKYTKARQGQLLEALIEQDEKKAQSILIQILSKTISYHDEVEAFYHGFLGGLLVCDGYTIKSNRESGNGRFDLSAIPEDYNNPCIIIECKISKKRKDLKSDSLDAVNQVLEKEYLSDFIAEGFDPIYVYGIAFYKKTCFITKLENREI